MVVQLSNSRLNKCLQEGNTGTGKTNVTLKAPSDICFSGSPLSVILAIFKCLATQSGERGRNRDGCRLKAESLSFQTTPGSALEAFTILRYGLVKLYTHLGLMESVTVDTCLNHWKSKGFGRIGSSDGFQHFL